MTFIFCPEVSQQDARPSAAFRIGHPLGSHIIWESVSPFAALFPSNQPTVLPEGSDPAAMIAKAWEQLSDSKKEEWKRKDVQRREWKKTLNSRAKSQ